MKCKACGEVATLTWEGKCFGCYMTGEEPAPKQPAKPARAIRYARRLAGIARLSVYSTIGRQI